MKKKIIIPIILVCLCGIFAFLYLKPQTIQGYKIVAFDVPAKQCVTLGTGNINSDIPEQIYKTSEVEKMLKSIPEEKYKDTPVNKGDLIVYSYTGLVNGEEFKGSSKSGEAGVVGQLTDIVDFNEDILGMSMGDTKTLQKETSQGTAVFTLYLDKVYAPEIFQTAEYKENKEYIDKKESEINDAFVKLSVLSETIKNDTVFQIPRKLYNKYKALYPGDKTEVGYEENREKFAVKNACQELCLQARGLN